MVASCACDASPSRGWPFLNHRTFDPVPYPSSPSSLTINGCRDLCHYTLLHHMTLQALRFCFSMSCQFSEARLGGTVYPAQVDTIQFSFYHSFIHSFNFDFLLLVREAIASM
jgi:hypothetical protein